MSSWSSFQFLFVTLGCIFYPFLPSVERILFLSRCLLTCLSFAQQYEWLIGSQYKPMELTKSDWAAIRKSPTWAIDSWGLGKFLLSNEKKIPNMSLGCMIWLLSSLIFKWYPWRVTLSWLFLHCCWSFSCCHKAPLTSLFWALSI